MFFYVLLTPPLLATVIMIWRLRSMEKHDKVLYRFCEIRRQTMSLIRERNFDLTPEDYLALRQVAEATSATIHDYNSFKIYIFNFRKFLAAIRRMEKLEVTLTHGRELKPEITMLRNRFADAMLFAFVTFTPFFKSERVLLVFHHTCSALAKLGIAYFKTKARGMAEIASFVEREKQTPTFS